MRWGSVKGWRLTALAACLLAVASLLVNITTEAQLSGQDQEIFAFRRTISLLLNSGTVWAGLSVFAGWLVRRHLPAALAGIAAGTGALVVHYGLGEVTGLMPSGSFTSNVFWFAAAAVTGAPLGLVGALTRTNTRWGLLARLLVPVGALVEPWLVGWWQSSGLHSAAERTSNLTAAAILTLAGLMATAWVTRDVHSVRSQP